MEGGLFGYTRHLIGLLHVIERIPVGLGIASSAAGAQQYKASAKRKSTKKDRLR